MASCSCADRKVHSRPPVDASELDREWPGIGMGSGREGEYYDGGSISREEWITHVHFGGSRRSDGQSPGRERPERQDRSTHRPEGGRGDGCNACHGLDGGGSHPRRHRTSDPDHPRQGRALPRRLAVTRPFAHRRPARGPIAAGCLQERSAQRQGRSGSREHEEPVLPRGTTGRHAHHRMVQCLRVRGESAGDRGGERTGHRGRGRIRTPARLEAGGQGNRPRLPRSLQRPQLAPGVDPQDAGHHRPRRLRAHRGRWSRRSSGDRRGRIPVARDLRRSHQPLRAFCPGWRLHVGGCLRGVHPWQWLRRALQAVRHRRGQHAGGGGRHRGRKGAGGE